MGMIKIFLLCLLITVEGFSQTDAYSQIVKKEYFGMYKYRFDGLMWKVAKVDTHWLSKWEPVYMGETWRFRLHEYDSVDNYREELRYYFHGGQQLTAIQFVTFSYDSLQILEKLQKYAAILRSNGRPSFYPDPSKGGQWPTGGGPTSLCKVWWFDFGRNGSWPVEFHGSMVLDFSYHHYSVVQNWEGGVQPYWISFNYYPYNLSTSNIPHDPGYGPDIPFELLMSAPDAQSPFIFFNH